jgi:hypothetical protein
MSWTTLRDTTPKARKRYRCTGCWEFIEAGEKHRHQVGIFDGDFNSNRWHPECFDFALDGETEMEVTPGQFSRSEALAATSAPAPESVAAEPNELEDVETGEAKRNGKEEFDG